MARAKATTTEVKAKRRKQRRRRATRGATARATRGATVGVAAKLRAAADLIDEAGKLLA